MGFKKHFINVPEAADKALAAGASPEMMVAMPNAYTRFAGSMYSSSAVMGDWEGFVANELVTYVDGHYRTLAKPLGTVKKSIWPLLLTSPPLRSGFVISHLRTPTVREGIQGPDFFTASCAVG